MKETEFSGKQKRTEKTVPDRIREDRTFLVCGLLFACSEVWKQLCLMHMYGSIPWSWQPFQLCSMPMYLCLIAGISGRLPGGGAVRAACVTFLSDFSLMSGIIVFLDTTGMHYGYAPLTVHSYAWHIAQILVSLYAGTRKRDCSFRAFLPAAGLYLVTAGIAELINLATDRFDYVNMFYINPHYEMNQIVFRDLRPFLPNAAVIILYICATILGGLIFHALWKSASMINCKRKE